MDDFTVDWTIMPIGEVKNILKYEHQEIMVRG